MTRRNKNLGVYWQELTKDEKQWLIVALNHARKFESHACCYGLPEIWEGILPFVSLDKIHYVLGIIYVSKHGEGIWAKHRSAHKSLITKWKITPSVEVRREYNL